MRKHLALVAALTVVLGFVLYGGAAVAQSSDSSEQTSVNGQVTDSTTNNPAIDYRPLSAEERSNMPPLMERYVLDELKNLRTEMQGMRAELLREVVNRQLEAIDKAISYSSNTVTYFFYFVAAVGALLTMLGWQSCVS